MAAHDARKKLLDWRKSEQLTLADAGSRVGATATAWYEWESGTDVPQIHTALEIQKVTGGKVTLQDWGRISRAKSAARAKRRQIPATQ